MLSLTGVPFVERYPEATVVREGERIVTRFGGFADEQAMSIPLGYVGTEDPETTELLLLARLQRIGYRVERANS